MPIEEITLSMPSGLPEAQHDDVGGTSLPANAAKASAEVNKLVAAYARSARARDRFAFTKSGRARRRERYNQSLKAIVKKIATDASSPVADRSTRMRVRTQIYVDLMHLADAMSKDQLRVMGWARARTRFSLATALVGLLGIAATLIMNDFIPWPLGVS